MAPPPGKMPRQDDVKRYRALLPTSQQPSEPIDEDLKGTGPRRPRPPLTRVACGACRSRKTRCCGSRPVCEQCQIRGSECTYMSKDKTETRFEALKRECDTLRQKTNSLQVIVDRLRHEPEDVAQATLRELRADQSLVDGDASLSELDGSSSYDEQPSDQLPVDTTAQVSQSIQSVDGTMVMTPDYVIPHQWNSYLSDEQTPLATSTGINSSVFPAMTLPPGDMSADGMMYEVADTNPLDTYEQNFHYTGEMGGLSVEGVYADAGGPHWYHARHEEQPHRDWNR